MPESRQQNLLSDIQELFGYLAVVFVDIEDCHLLAKYFFSPNTRLFGWKGICEASQHRIHTKSSLSWFLLWRTSFSQIARFTMVPLARTASAADLIL